jgi:hypothetical protein
MLLEVGMQTRKIFFLFLSVFGLILLGACAASTPPAQIEGAEAAQVLAFADPAADNILASLVSRDFKAYARDFDEVMLKASKTADFEKMVATFDTQLGGYQSRKDGTVYLIGEQGKKYYLVVYSVKFAKGTLAMQVSFNIDSSHTIAGLYFK